MIENVHCGKKSRGTLRGRDQQFGVWLRASTPNLSQRTVIQVVRIEDDEYIEGGDLNGDNEGMESVPRKDGVDDTEQGTVLVDEEDVFKRWGVEFDGSLMGDLLIIKAYPKYPDGIKENPTDMETNLNSSAVSSLVKEVQIADF